MLHLMLEASGVERSDVVARLRQAIAMIENDGENETHGDELSFDLANYDTDCHDCHNGLGD
jgi:hypothetical protein